MSVPERAPAPLPRRRWTILIPTIFVTYGLAYLDRVNTALLFPHVADDIPMSGTTAGLAQGATFLGFVLLQVPGVWAAHRWGPRRVVFWCMVAWGLAAMCTGLVQDMTQMVIMRFVLGLAEGPLLPIMIYLLSKYFVSTERARSAAWFLLALPLTQVFFAPLTGFLLEHFHWRAVFVIEGAPPVVWAFVWLLVAANTPEQARWLKPSESAAVTERISAEEATKVGENRVNLATVARQRVVWVYSAAYFAGTGAAVGLTLWLPTIIRELSASATPLQVGLLTALPSLVGAVALVLAARWSDARNNRRIPMLTGFGVATVALLIGTQLPGTLWAQMTVCIVASSALLSISGAMSSLPGSVLSQAAAAAALAVGNIFGAIGQFLGPFLIGALRDVTDGSRAVTYVVLGCLCALGFAASALIVDQARSTTPKAPARKEASPERS
jgi:MFS family permease